MNNRRKPTGTHPSTMHPLLPTPGLAADPRCEAPAGALRTHAGAAALMAAAVLALAGCETPPASGDKAAPSKPAATAKPASTAASAPPAPEPVVVAPALPPGTVQKYITSAIELLEGGNENEASAELQRALQLDPGNRLALSLQRQISADPVATLGRESFVYRVQPGESLSRIAQRFMGDLHLFYILARYNDIKVPRQLAGGQSIRVPGKAPPASATPAAAATATTAPPTASPPAPPQRASNPADAARADRERAERAERDRKAAIEKSTRAARQAFARQDLDAAIAQWDRVLELDAGNATAKLERQRAVELKEKLGRMK
jgi:LysM repeat protein